MSNRMLVVEDHEDLRGVLCDLLTGSGYTVIEAADGEVGVAKAKSDHPDLILMDIQMPVIDGYEATRRIKADPDSCIAALMVPRPAGRACLCPCRNATGTMSVEGTSHR